MLKPLIFENDLAQLAAVIVDDEQVRLELQSYKKKLMVSTGALNTS